jgi:hypothetical protein
MPPARAPNKDVPFKTKKHEEEKIQAPYISIVLFTSYKIIALAVLWIQRPVTKILGNKF